MRNKTLEWNEYPIGTKVYAFDGGYWIRVETGWKWFCGDTFPTPGADWDRIELPEKPFWTCPECGYQYNCFHWLTCLTCKSNKPK